MGISQPKKLNSAQKATLSPGQCRAARGLIDVSQRDLADAAGVSLTAIKDFEASTRTPRPATLKAIQDALEAAGVELIPVNGGGEGVRRTGGVESTSLSPTPARRSTSQLRGAR